MERNILIKGTDLVVSPIAMGTVNAGLDYEESEADELFHYYTDHGGNIIDTARVYSDWIPPEIGRSERVVGNWLKRSGRRNEIVLITKGGHPRNETMHVSRMKKADMQGDIELSLKALGTDYIDIYFYHRDDINQPVGELIETMEEFKKQGKIRYYGCSNWTTERMIEAEKYAFDHKLTGFIANQDLYNMGLKYMKPLDDDTMISVDAAMLEFHRQADNTLMPYFGICSGFFHMLKAKGIEAVKNSPYFTEGNQKVAQLIDQLCEKYNASITQVLLGFFLVQDFPVIPLVGSSNMSQLKDMMGTTEILFQKEDYIF